MLLKQTIEDVNDPQSRVKALNEFPQGVQNACVFLCVRDYEILRRFNRDVLTMVVDLETILTGHMATYKGMKIYVSRGIEFGDIYWATNPQATVLWKNSHEKKPTDVSDLVSTGD